LSLVPFINSEGAPEIPYLDQIDQNGTGASTVLIEPSQSNNVS